MESKEYPPIFRYSRPTVPDGAVSISPSFLPHLYTNPGEWYRGEVLHQPKAFQGNTATVTGTICHYIYDHVTRGIDYSDDEIQTQLIQYAGMRPELELDVPKIINDYKQVAQCVRILYVEEDAFVRTEEQVMAQVGDNIYIAGTVDRIEPDNTLVDFKTVSSKPNTEKIPMGYKLQLMAYVRALEPYGTIINRIRIVYGVKPTKTLGARAYIVTEEITDEHNKLIDYTLNLIRCSIDKCRKHPDLVPLIFRDFDTANLY